jgi:HK97 family phage portal protein
MSDLIDHGPYFERKGLSVSLEPGGFVTEVRDYGRMRSPRADTATLEATMSLNELVYACIAVKATAARDPRLTVQVQKSQGGKLIYEEAPGHPFRSLIMRPNDRMTEGDLTRAAIVSWDVSNPRRFYAEKEYVNGLLVGLHPLNPAMMRPKYSQAAGRQLIGYTWGDGAQSREYRLDELLIRSAPAWYDPPPLVAALGATESDTAQTDYIRAFFENGGVPPGLLKYSMPLNDEKRQEIRDKWRSTYGNRYGRSHDIGILDSNVDFQQTGSKLDELQSQTLRSVAESRICMVFGVPPLIVYAYVGLLRATYSNLGEAWRGFWDATMSPMFKELKDFWTWSLLTEFEDERDIRGERVKLAYDMSTVAALQEDVDAIQKRSEQAWRAGGISRAEYRQALSQPSDPSDAFYLLPAGAVVVPVGSVPAPAAAAAPERAKRAQKTRTRGSVQLTERRIERAMQTYLAREYERAAQAVA